MYSDFSEDFVSIISVPLFWEYIVTKLNNATAMRHNEVFCCNNYRRDYR